jgi:putative membrane protein
MMHELNGGMTAMMIASGVFYLTLLVLAVLAIVWLIRSLRRPAGTAAVARPEEVLRRRYAAGQINDEEYRQRLAGLQG